VQPSPLSEVRTFESPEKSFISSHSHSPFGNPWHPLTYFLLSVSLDLLVLDISVYYFFLKGNQAWWCTPVIPALRRLRQEDHEFKASLGYITTKKKKPKNEQTNKTKLKESHFK
jgi:hypothetical protein